MGLTFFVNEHVLDPETRIRKRWWSLCCRSRRIRIFRSLICGTGSGCIAVSLKKLGGYAHVEGADISEEALKVARKNAAENPQKTSGNAD